MKVKPSENKLVNNHLRELHGFLDHIMRYAEDPSSWPLTPHEQMVFTRTVLYQAHKLRKTEGYLATMVMLTAEDLALAS